VVGDESVELSLRRSTKTHVAHLLFTCREYVAHPPACDLAVSGHPVGPWGRGGNYSGSERGVVEF
jgi:hypothetical protein